jgi:hypothetical protein
MKYTLPALLMIVFNTMAVSAQKHNLYVDAGVCGSRINLGLSATYNYKPVKWFGIGAGLQTYDFFPRLVDVHQYVPAVFGDLRFNIRPGKTDQFFLFLDLGIDFYKHTGLSDTSGTVIYTDIDDNGSYTGFGFGYFRALKNNSWGPYGSLKLISNGYNADAYNFATGERYVESGSRGTIVLSFGLRF